MALKDRPRVAHKPPVHGAPCSVGELYRQNLADADELAEIQQVLYGDNLDAGRVLKEFTDAGYVVARTAINKHRGRNCRCFTIDRDFCPDCRQHLDAHADACDKAA